MFMFLSTPQRQSGLYDVARDSSCWAEIYLRLLGKRLRFQSGRSIARQHDKSRATSLFSEESTSCVLRRDFLDASCDLRPTQVSRISTRHARVRNALSFRRHWPKYNILLCLCSYRRRNADLAGRTWRAIHRAGPRFISACWARDCTSRAGDQSPASTINRAPHLFFSEESTTFPAGAEN